MYNICVKKHFLTSCNFVFAFLLEQNVEKTWPQFSAWASNWSLMLAVFMVMMCVLYWSEIKSALKHIFGTQGRQFSADARPISFSFSVSEATGTATSP